MTGVASWSLLRFEVLGGEGSGGCVGVDSDQFQPFIPYTLSLNHTPPIPLPSTPCSPARPLPPSTHHLPPQGCNTGKLTGEERVKERGWAAFCLLPARVCVCLRVHVCVLGLNTLFVVCVRRCVRRGGKARGGADGQPLCSLLYCVHIYSFSLYLLSVPLSQLFPSVFSSLVSSSFHPLFFTTLFFLFLPLSPSVVL